MKKNHFKAEDRKKIDDFTKKSNSVTRIGNEANLKETNVQDINKKMKKWQFKQKILFFSNKEDDKDEYSENYVFSDDHNFKDMGLSKKS